MAMVVCVHGTLIQSHRTAHAANSNVEYKNHTANMLPLDCVLCCVCDRAFRIAWHNQLYALPCTREFHSCLRASVSVCLSYGWMWSVGSCVCIRMVMRQCACMCTRWYNGMAKNIYRSCATVFAPVWFETFECEHIICGSDCIPHLPNTQHKDTPNTYTHGIFVFSQSMFECISFSWNRNVMIEIIVCRLVPVYKWIESYVFSSYANFVFILVFIFPFFDITNLNEIKRERIRELTATAITTTTTETKET